MDTIAQLEARARQLLSQIAGWEDDHKRASQREFDLERELAQVHSRLDIARDSKRRADEKIAAAREEIEGIERLLPRKPTVKLATVQRKEPGETEIREAILRFRLFTVAELAGVLRVPVKTAEALLAKEEERGIVRPTGRKQARSPVYEYVPPADSGDAFRVQQEHRAVASENVVALPVAGVGEGYLSALPKDVRKVARKAMRDGWALTQAGDKHMRLERHGKVITLAGSPQNPTAEARTLERKLRQGGMELVQRGAPVPHTGKPMGRTGKPGLDKRLANTGRRRVKSK